MNKLGKEEMTVMVGVVPVYERTTHEAAIARVARTASDRLSETACTYYLSVGEARRPDELRARPESWEVPVQIWVSHPDRRYGELWELLETLCGAKSLTVLEWGSDHTPGE